MEFVGAAAATGSGVTGALAIVVDDEELVVLLGTVGKWKKVAGRIIWLAGTGAK